MEFKMMKYHGKIMEFNIRDVSLDVIISQLIAHFAGSFCLQKYNSDFASEQLKYFFLHQKTRYVFKDNYFCNIIMCFCLLYSTIWLNTERKTFLVSLAAAA